MDEFNFYNSENDGYRGSFGGYVDPEPVMPNTPRSTGGTPRKKRGGAARVVALVLACTIAGGGAGVGGAYLYHRLAGPENTTAIYEEERPRVQTIVNTNNGQPMTPEQLYAANLASCVGHHGEHHGEHLRPDHHLRRLGLRLCPQPGGLHRHQLPCD